MTRLMAALWVVPALLIVDGLLFILALSTTCYAAGVPTLTGVVTLHAAAAGLTALFAWRTRLHWKAVAALLVGVVVVTGLIGWSWDRRFRTLADQLRADGRLASLADLPAAGDPATNAAPAIRAWAERFTRTATGVASPTLEISTIGSDLDGPPGRSSTGGLRQAHRWPPDAAIRLGVARARLAPQFASVEGELHWIAATARRWAPHDWTAMAGNPLTFNDGSGVLHVVTAIRLIRLIAYERALRGDLPGAWSAVARQITLTRLSAQDPMLVSRTASIAGAGQVSRTIVGIIQNVPKAALPEWLVAQVRELIATPWAPAGFAAEAAWGLDVRRALRNAWTVEAYGPDLMVTQAKLAIFRGAIWTGIADAVQWDALHRLLLPLAGAKGWPPAGAERTDAFTADRAWINPFVPFDFPAVGHFYQKDIEAKARLQLTLVCAALHGYRNRTRTYPVELKALVPLDLPAALLTDPLTGRSFEYKQLAKGAGYELSSPGADGTHIDSRDQWLGLWEPLPAGQPAPSPASNRRPRG